MARIAWPSTLTAAVPRPLGWMRVLMPVLLVAGCAPWDRPLPIPKEVTQAGAAARVVVPRDLNVNPSESVVEPGTPAAEPAPSQGPGPERTIFALPRSEEHTSELQSLTNLVCRLLLEKKKKKTNTKEQTTS